MLTLIITLQIESAYEDDLSTQIEEIKPLKGKSVLDVGCGGGVLSEVSCLQFMKFQSQ